MRGDSQVPAQLDRLSDGRRGGIQPNLIDAALGPAARAAGGAEVLAGVDPPRRRQQRPPPGLLGGGVEVADEGGRRLAAFGQPLEGRIDQGPRALRGPGVPIHLGDPERHSCPQAEDEALHPPRGVVRQGAGLAGPVRVTETGQKRAAGGRRPASVQHPPVLARHGRHSVALPPGLLQQGQVVGPERSGGVNAERRDIDRAQAQQGQRRARPGVGSLPNPAPTHGPATPPPARPLPTAAGAGAEPRPWGAAPGPAPRWPARRPPGEAAPAPQVTGPAGRAARPPLPGRPVRRAAARGETHGRGPRRPARRPAAARASPAGRRPGRRSHEPPRSRRGVRRPAGGHRPRPGPQADGRERTGPRGRKTRAGRLRYRPYACRLLRPLGGQAPTPAGRECERAPSRGGGPVAGGEPAAGGE